MWDIGTDILHFHLPLLFFILVLDDVQLLRQGKIQAPLPTFYQKEAGKNSTIY
jgi:hypothetical protein